MACKITGCRLLALSVLLIFLSSCASSAPVIQPEPKRSFERKGILINYNADKSLNLYEGAARTVILIVYQVDRINAFKDLAKSEEGLRKLLQNEQFDPSVVGRDLYVIEPGEQKKLEIDRYENTKWIGLVAGYYDLQGPNITKTYEIPVKTEKKGVYGFRKTEVTVERLDLKLLFGPHSIQEVNS